MYQFRVYLRRISPIIWRRILVRHANDVSVLLNVNNETLQATVLLQAGFDDGHFLIGHDRSPFSAPISFAMALFRGYLRGKLVESNDPNVTTFIVVTSPPYI